MGGEEGREDPVDTQEGGREEGREGRRGGGGEGGVGGLLLLLTPGREALDETNHILEGRGARGQGSGGREGGRRGRREGGISGFGYSSWHVR